MRSVVTRYPVDRYMVESSKKYEMVNIIDDDLWKTEPALKPEDELILRKLHEMLQSTADDLKLLSGELSKFHEPGVQIKTAPTPLDEEFNEKVHIEEIVNAKFHGYKIVDKPPRAPEYKPRNDRMCNTRSKNNVQNSNKYNANVHTNNAPVVKKPLIRNLGISRTKVIEIDGNQNSTKTEKLNNGRVVSAPVAYNEYSFKYAEPEFDIPCKKLQVQVMPSINIRGELKEQKVLQLDIIPESKECEKSDLITKNVAVVAVQHEVPVVVVAESHKPDERQKTSKSKIRKISKLSTCDSSSSTNISSDTQMKLKTQQRFLTNLVNSNPQKGKPKKESDNRSQAYLNEWRKRLNIVYGSSLTKKHKTSKIKSKPKVSPKKKDIVQATSTNSSALNNTEYIPYSKLTIGGATASDIEREMSNIPIKNNMPLSPILDKIISSRENSARKIKSHKQKNNNKIKVLTTSDENLLEEVIDIERTVSETLSKNTRIKHPINNPEPLNVSSDSDETKENESYVDDFEDEKSDYSGLSTNAITHNRHSAENSKKGDNENECISDDSEVNNDKIGKDVQTGPSTSNINKHNLTYTKVPNLSFKNQIDVFEFVHSVDTQDSATQSSGAQRISPKETQTTPRNDKNVQAIHNDLWPTIDPKGRVEKMFELEKDFIKKFIVEEYGGILEQNITKPSTSKEVDNTINIAASQKNTQTSPAHVKNIMTSPTRTKTRTTSPFATIRVDTRTSPLIFVTKENEIKLDTDLNEEDQGISANLSSPRFNLRLPRNSQEVLSGIEDSVLRTNNKSGKNIGNSSSKAIKVATEQRNAINVKKSSFNATTTSTSSIEADSSELSSLGEVKLRRMLNQSVVCKATSDWESVSSTSSIYSLDAQLGILPLRSEGETSIGLTRKSNRHSKSEGEASFGML